MTLFYMTKDSELAKKLIDKGYKVIGNKEDCYFIFEKSEASFDQLGANFSETEIKQLIPTNTFYL